MNLDEVLQKTADYCKELLKCNHDAENQILIERAMDKEPNILVEYSNNVMLLIRFQAAPK